MALQPSAEIRLIIKRTKFTLQLKDDKEQWRAPVSIFETMRFQSAPATLVGVMLSEGQDKDGQWVEHQDAYLTKKDASTVFFYWFRAVNNLDLPPSNSQSKWSLFRLAELHKIN